MMTSFLVKERTKETYLQKISSEPQGTQQNRIVTINNFERFVSELYEEKTIESVIEELKILKKTEEERYLDALYDLLQEWINWNTEQEIESSTQRTFFFLPEKLSVLQRNQNRSTRYQRKPKVWKKDSC